MTLHAAKKKLTSKRIYDLIKNNQSLTITCSVIVDSIRYFKRFCGMLTRAGIATNTWTLVVNWNYIKVQEQVDKDISIRILATIVHLLKELPIMFNNDNLIHFRVNLTLALYHDTSLL